MALTVARELMGVAQGCLHVPVRTFARTEEPLDPEVKRQQSEFEQVFMRLTAKSLLETPHRRQGRDTRAIRPGGAKSCPASRQHSLTSLRRDGQLLYGGSLELPRSCRARSSNSSDVGSAQSGPVVVDCEGVTSPTSPKNAPTERISLIERISRNASNDCDKKEQLEHRSRRGSDEDAMWGYLREESRGRNSLLEGISMRLAAVEEQFLFMQREIDGATNNWNTTVRHQESVIERLERDVKGLKEQLRKRDKSIELWQKHMETCSGQSGTVSSTDVKIIVDAVLNYTQSSSGTACTLTPSSSPIGSTREISSGSSILASQIRQGLQRENLYGEAAESDSELRRQLDVMHAEISAKFNALERNLNGKIGERISFCAASDTTTEPPTSSNSFGTVISSTDLARKSGGEKSGSDSSTDPVCQSAEEKSTPLLRMWRTRQRPAPESTLPMQRSLDASPQLSSRGSPQFATRPATTGRILTPSVLQS
mmetsp:Transcript_84154/g.146152  ORF Transcript_84154/g.146152 Transcript_84154/m.146152 type:complete len:482 (+) Transcript_84154:66-1511(+)